MQCLVAGGDVLREAGTLVADAMFTGSDILEKRHTVEDVEQLAVWNHGEVILGRGGCSFRPAG
jgi:hypothetical protein